MSDLKPGDRALVVWMNRAESKRHIGDTVTVQTAPAWDEAEWPHPAGLYVDAVYHATGEPSRVLASRLVKIPPDSEMRQMFRETSKPKETA